MEKIDFAEARDSLFEWTLVHALTMDEPDEIKLHPALENWKPGEPLQIEFKVNGVELPVIKAFQDIDNQLDRLIEEKAAVLVEEKFSEITEVAEGLVEGMRELAKRKGVKIKSYYDE